MLCLPSRFACMAAMCSWATSTMKRRLLKPLIVMDGCTQETLAKFKWVSVHSSQCNQLHGVFLISCVPFTFTVGWFLVHYWQDQRWGYHIIVLLYMYILKLEFYHQIAIPKLPVFYKLSWRKKLFGAKTTYIPPFFPRLSLSYLYNPPPSVKHSDLAGSSTTQP